MTLLGLLYVVGHAAAGITGPESSLREAQLAFDQQLYTKSIALLDNAFDDLSSSAPVELRARILTLRGQALLRIKDFRLAISDFQLIHQLQPHDSQVATTLIHSLISNQQPQAALVIAGKLLAADAGNMRIQELSGEAEQMIYQGLIRSLRQQLELELGPRSLDAAIDAIRPWFYRDDDDPQAQLSRTAFDEILRIKSPRAYAAGRFDAPLATIHSSVGRAMQYYRAAFELDGMPVAAYQGFSYALEQGGRLDDLQALAEIYMLRFQHWRAVQAAITLTELHLDNFRYRATVDASDRYLPPGTWRERDESNAIRLVLDAKSAALFELGAFDELSQLAAETRRMQNQGEMNLRPEFFFIQLRDREAEGDNTQANRFINQLRNSLPRRPNNEGLKEKLLIVLRRQFANAIKFKQNDNTFNWIFRSWLAIDGNRPEVHLAKAQFLGEIGEYSQMVASAKRALALNSHDEESFRIYTQAADVFYHQSSRGSEDLLLRTLALDQLIPEDLTSDHLLMPLAERALEHGHFMVAQACAFQATQVFNWAKWPKYLLIKAHLALGEPELAMQAAEALLAFYPEDVEGIRLLQQGRESAGRSTTDLLFRLLMIGEHDTKMARDLLEFASEHEDVVLEAGIAQTLIEMAPGDLHALDRIAMRQYAQGELQAARKTLAGIVSATQTAEDRDAAFALSREFLMTLLVKGKAGIGNRFDNLLILCSAHPDLATDLAADLVTLGLPDLAAELLDPIVLGSRYAKQRSGQQFLLAAQMAIASGHNFEAIAHLKSARSFEDGLQAGMRIAILQIRMGNFGTALAELGDRPASDFLSACLSARLGRTKAASDWLGQWLPSNPLDFKARLLSAILDPSSENSPLIRPLIDQSPTQVLGLLILLSADSFDADALVAAGALLRTFPRDPLSLYLYAEAQANSGSAQRALTTLSQLIARRPEFTAAYYRVLQLLPRVSRQDRPDLRLLPSADAGPQSILPTDDFRALLSVIPGSIIEAMANDWIMQAATSDLGIDEIRFLLNLNLVEKALQLSEAIAIAGGEQNPKLWRDYHRVATTILTRLGQADLLIQAGMHAVANVADEIEIGSAVDFLLQLDLARSGPLGERRDLTRVARLHSWITAHLDSAKRGATSDPASLSRSLETLAKLSGRASALEQIDKLLTADPSLLEIWILRARWLAQDGRLEQGLTGLRGILDFIPDNPAHLTIAELAAGRANVDLRPIRDSVGNLPRLLRESPDGRLSRGLLALRGAEYELADRLLADCAERANGSPIYYRALANLSLARVSEARALFLQLAADYPASSLSVNALHFAAQLSN